MPITIANLSKEFRGQPRKALKGISHEIPDQDITVIIGTNGSGKSTLLNCVIGLLPFEQGRIEVESTCVKYELGSDNTNGIPIDIRKHIGYMFQQKALWQHLTVLQNLLHPLTRVHKLSYPQALERAKEYLELLKVNQDYYNRFPSELSGGEQRKVAIARTLSIKPELLVIDEPEANLDQTARKLILEIIHDEFVSQRKTVLMVSHSIDLLEQFTPNILVLHDGRVVESGRGITQLLCKEHLTSEEDRIIKQSVDSSSSRWFNANLSLQAAIRISEINIAEKDLGKLLSEIGKEISKLITRFDPEAQHLLLIATRLKNGSNSAEVRIRCAEKTKGFVLDGAEVSKLGMLVKRDHVDERQGRFIWDFKAEYDVLLQTNQGITLQRKVDVQGHDSLIDMMFDEKGMGLKYQFTERHPLVPGAYNIKVPIPEGHDDETHSYYEFSKQTRNVYLIGCVVGDEVKGIISIDTHAEKKWSNFIVQQLILVGNMVAIAIKHHEETEVVKLTTSTGPGKGSLAQRHDEPYLKAPRSTFPKGFFSAIDSIHVHVDGGVAANLVENVVEVLDREGYPSKVTSIQETIAGPQRQDLLPTYKSHTPGTDDQEKLEYFSTTIFKSVDETKQQLKRLLGELATQDGIVIEAERVMGKIGQEVRWSKTPLREVPIIQSAEVGFERSNTLPIEVHYGCDIRKTGEWSEVPPLGLERLLEICAELEIRVGGWFLFQEANTWCYRSNMFEGNILPERVETQRDDLAEHLNRIGDELGFTCEVTALVERSLGVWKTPLTPWTSPRSTEGFNEPAEVAK